METSQFYCLNCTSLYNLTTHIPVILDCGDEICLDCYKNKIVQQEDGTFACCFDNEHKIEKIENPIQVRKIINKLKSMDVLRIVCDKHKEQYSEYYCPDCDQIVCQLCKQLDHLYHNVGYLHQVKPSNFKEFHNFVLPLLDKQLEMITNLKNNYSSYINESENHLSSDFISMLNNTKLLLKDFIQNQQEPQEEYKKSQNFRQGVSRWKFNIFEVALGQANKYADYYKSYLKLVNWELQRESYSTISTYMKDWNRAQLKLLYQGSRHGFESQTFHQLCDNQGPTIAFVLSEFGQTFGGYTSISWTLEEKSKEDKNAFLFQLNKRSIHPIEKSLDRSVRHLKDHLIVFNGINQDHDLLISDQCDQNRDSYSGFGGLYKLPLGYTYNTEDSKKYLAGGHKFKVLEIEIYSVKIF
eukprot:403331842